MTAKVISLCDYRKSRDEEKRSRRENGLGLLRPTEFPVSTLRCLIPYDPDLDLDTDDE
jgi:hypothetical protein